MLFQHVVLLFGARAAVWAYNRVGDTIVFLARLLLSSAIWHYVDDYSGIEDEVSAQSAFEAFEELNGIIGFTMKKAKRQPPAPANVVQGVTLGFDDELVTAAPTQRRRDKLVELIELARVSISAQSAASLAGKANFLGSTLFGRIGRASLGRLYDRSRMNQAEGAPHASLARALECLQQIVAVAQPCQTPLSTAGLPTAIEYADAFFEMGDAAKRGGIRTWNQATAYSKPNGWGVVIIPRNAPTLFLYGTVPRSVMASFKRRKQYIFMLEAAAQCIAMWVFWPELAPRYWGFCDNTAAEGALWKGHSKDEEASMIVSLFWMVAARTGVAPWIDRVPTHLQLADEVSRQDTEKALESGWVDAKCELAPMWQLLKRWLKAKLHPSMCHAEELLTTTARIRRRAGLATPRLPTV